MQTGGATPPLTWFEVVLTFSPAVACLIAMWRIRSGWGGRWSSLSPHTAWSEFLLRLVYVILPFAVASFLMALGGGLFARLFYDTGSDWFRFGGLLVFVVGLVCMGWGLKEFMRPSRWRRQPDWLVEYEARAKRRSG